MPEICVVIPCYNEANRLDTRALGSFIGSHPGVHFCFVNDGSKDGTAAVLEKMHAEHRERVAVVDMPKNSGKAEAVRCGIVRSVGLNKYAAVGFWDADLSTPLEEIPRMAACLEQHSGCSAVLGSRVKRLGARIERRATRHIMGRIFSTLSNWILKIPFYDSQCGAKLFRTGLAAAVFAEPFCTKWLFDVEIIARIRNRFGREQALDLLVELPLLRWKDVKGSKLKPGDYVKVPLELLKIHFAYNR